MDFQKTISELTYQPLAIQIGTGKLYSVLLMIALLMSEVVG